MMPRQIIIVADAATAVAVAGSQRSESGKIN
jgi:hypothetical protein